MHLPTDRLRRRDLLAWLTSPAGLLAVVCAWHGVSSILLVGLHHGFGWDETVYLSQINSHAPAGIFSAPRARGLTIVVAPVTLLTNSVAVVRVWLSLVTAVGMYAAFRPWLRLVDRYAVPVAAFAFSALWTTIFYGFEAMPNLYVALGALGAVAHFLLYCQDRRRSSLVWVFGCLAFVALMRPSDAAFLLLPLLVAGLVLRGLDRRDRWWLSGSVVLGFVGGTLEWVLEAFVRFGGPINRLHLAQAEQGHSGPQFSLIAQARTLAGPLLCRGTCHVTAPWWAMLWWFALPLLVAVALIAARRRADLTPLVLATAAGAAVAAEYIFTVDYSAPRFLTPAYALLLLPAAAGLVQLVHWTRRSWRPIGIAAVSVLLLALTASQVSILRADVTPLNDRGLGQWNGVVHSLRDQLGVRPPCLVVGHDAPPLAFAARCGSDPTARGSVLAIVRAGSETVVWLSRHRHFQDAPRYVDAWEIHRLRNPRLVSRWYAAVSRPRAAATSAYRQESFR